MIRRHWPGAAAAALTLTLALCFGLRTALVAQSPAAPAGPQATPTQTAAQKFKNIQILKDLPADQLDPTMRYIAASLGVQCDFCHVLGPGGGFDKDDKDNKQTARKMMQMVSALNVRSFEGRSIVNCATCHHGRFQPERTPPLAAEMTPEQAAESARQQEMRRQQRAQGGRGGAPAAQPERGGGRGERPTETIDDVLAKYVQALGGRDALVKVKTRVMKGTVTMRDLQTSPLTVSEKAPVSYRIEIDSKAAPVVRAFDGPAGWVQAFGNVHDLEGLQLQQLSRQGDVVLPLTLKDRYQNLQVSRYGNIDGTNTVIVTGRSSDATTEQLQFDRQSGLLLRRSVFTRTPFGQLPEQFDYSDYRDVSGIKIPHQVRWSTWNTVQTEKFSEIALNPPVDDALFAKPAGAGAR